MTMAGLLRDDSGAPRSLPVYCFLLVAGALATLISELSTTLPALAVPTLVVPAAVMAVAVGRFGTGRCLTRLRQVLAMLVALVSAVPARPYPATVRPPGQADPCRRVEALLLAGPRAPGVRAA